MKLTDIAKKGLHYHISINIIAPEISEKMIEGVEVRIKNYQTIVTLMIYDVENKSDKSGEPTIVAKVQTVGIGRTQRTSERDGIKEALTRVVLG